MTTLPIPRALLTSLLNTFTPPSPSSSSPSSLHPESTTQPDQETSNPLKALPPSFRALLTTLHVIFPPPMLLQSLDLLDRGLVTRIILLEEEKGVEESARSEHEEGNEKEGESERVVPPQAGIHLTAKCKDLEKAECKTANPQIYQVHTSQSKPRFSRSSTSAATYANTHTEQSYIVRLTAWNCSCAAFVFSAFPYVPSISSSPLPLFSMSQEAERDGREIAGEGGEWEFGGSSFDGKEGQGVPICKHLLACLLAEKWGILGGYVKARNVGREEMAGLGVDG